MKKYEIQERKNYDHRLTVYNKVELHGENHAVGTFMTIVPKTRIKKLSKTEYQIIKTGEIKEFAKKDETAARSLRIIRKAHDKLKALIRCNFDPESDRQLFMTCTYQENMTDSERLMIDTDVFMHRMERYFKDNPFIYITVVEPQSRGAWHLHIMFKFENRIFRGFNKRTGMPQFIFPMKDIRNMWRGAIKGNGGVRLESLTSSSDDMGAYFGAYFRNLETEAKATELELMVDKQGKKYVKGGRLHLYPENMKFYRCSQGIIRPETVERSFYEMVSEYGNPIYESTYSVIEYGKENDGEPESQRTFNTVHTAQFNKLRNKQD
jgi:hypothetical protein